VAARRGLEARETDRRVRGARAAALIISAPAAIALHGEPEARLRVRSVVNQLRVA
jgi:hypothetical protein